MFPNMDYVPSLFFFSFWLQDIPSFFPLPIMARRNGALELVLLLCASLVASIARTHPHLSPSLSLSRTSAVKFCWNLCADSATRSGTYLGVFFLFILGEEFRVFSRCVDRWCIRNRVPRKWTRGAGIGW
jgi:hypothetical protein